ncbi:MAG: hypothetical protein JKY82_01895 [Rhizobiaceae bacterium]|nr:hypothetical protein [Rhizobiaceae bacterium]
MSFVALIKPLPKLRLGKRAFSFSVLLFAAFPGALLGTFFHQEAGLEELKQSNPEAYLEQLKDSNHARYMAELKLLNPDEHERIIFERKEVEAKLRSDRRQENARVQKLKDEKEKARKLAQEKWLARKAAALKIKQDNKKRLAAKLDNPKAIVTYCTGMAEIKVAYAKANELYDNDNDKWAEFTSSQDRALTERISQQLGLPKEDWLYYASKHNWEQKCKAGNHQQQSSASQSGTSGWQEVLNTDLKAAELNNAQATMFAQKDAFGQLAKGQYHAVLNANNYQTAKCMVIKDGAYRFAGCRLFGKVNGIARKSSPYIYEVGKLKNGTVVALPFSGAEEEILRSISPVIKGYNIQPGVYVDVMPIRDMDAASIKAQFKKRL